MNDSAEVINSRPVCGGPSAEPVVRRAVPGDLPAIKSCVDAAFSRYIERIGKEPEPMLIDYAPYLAHDAIYVIDGGPGLIAGIIVLLPMVDHLLLDTVAVAPEVQGRGFGQRLLSFAGSYAQAKRLPSLRVWTNVRMHESQAFYEKQGFVEMERKTVHGYHRICYNKALSMD